MISARKHWFGRLMPFLLLNMSLHTSV